MKIALAIASSIVLIIHGIVFYSQSSHGWMQHQEAYIAEAQNKATNDAERNELASRRPRLEQIIATQFGEPRVDRCVSCHVAVDDPRFVGHAQPLRAHPYSKELGDSYENGRWERRHKFTDFGCTVCHDGQGRGLDSFYAHGEDRYWPEPLIGYVAQAEWNEKYRQPLRGKDYMEANCAQCHASGDSVSMPHLERGRRLFFEKNCYGCHRIDDLSEGALGPDLSEVGKKWKLDYLWESLVDPRANTPVSFMPKFNLRDDEVKSLVIFLKSRRGTNPAQTSLQRYRARAGRSAAAGQAPVLQADLPEDPVARGEVLVRDRACAACHKLGNQDGGIAPDLSFEGLMKDTQWISDHFRDPRRLVPDSIMPSFRFSEPEFDAMTLYLTSLRTPPALGDSAEIYRTLCARCHGANGDGTGPVALYLDPAPRDLTKAGFMNSKDPARFVRSILDGVPGTAMPGWKGVLGQEQAQAVLDYVWSSFVREPRRDAKKRSVPETNPVVSTAESIARGKQIFVQRCTGCHGLKADGKGPNSIDILPRPRNLRNGPFINATDDRRLLESILYGVQGTAMPPWIDYGLTANDAGDLLNFIRSFQTRR
ncbi:MAG: c-type cytochrome [Acidobacteria bacterium]|nr:c-type cytochrome [Acidobacteriota bacterium]